MELVFSQNQDPKGLQAHSMKMKEYFTQTVQHDSVSPHSVVQPRPGKRQAHQQPSQKMQRSVSAIRLNDTNKSNFTIGHEDQIFSKMHFEHIRPASVANHTSHEQN